MMKKLNLTNGKELMIVGPSGYELMLPVYEDTDHLHLDHLRLNFDDRNNLGVKANKTANGYGNYKIDDFDEWSKEYKVIIKWTIE